MSPATLEQTEDALIRLARASAFERTEGLLPLLRFLLSETQQDPSGLKEASVGVAFYKREPTYNPRHDSIVRTNVRRLRHRLAEYYLTEGISDPVWIEIPVGTYRATAILASTEKPLATQPSLESNESASASGLPRASSAADELAQQKMRAVPDTSHGRSTGILQGQRWTYVLPFVVLVIAVGAFALRQQRASPNNASAPAPIPQPSPLTLGRGLEFQPATSRDGKHLAYVATLNGTEDYRIFLRPFARIDAAPTLLDTGKGDAFYPQWSPDGTQIAFLRCGDGPCEIATVPAAGGSVRSIRILSDYERPADHPYHQYRQLSPVWTSDGKSLIYPYRGLNDNAERLVVQDIASGATRTLTTGQTGDEDEAPAISFDGRTLAFLRQQLSSTMVMTLDLASGKTQVLATEPNLATSGITWAPGDRALVLSVNRAGRSSLQELPLQGSPRDMLLRLPSVIYPMFTGDGQSLMFLNADRTRSLVQVRGDAAPAPLFTTKQRNTFSGSSADGQRLAFLSDLSGHYEVWVISRTSGGWGEAHQLTHGLPGFPSSVTWSPDGRYIGVGISDSATLEMVDAKTGGMTPLRLPGMEHEGIWSPQWSSDGHWIYFADLGVKRGIFRASTGPVPAVQQVYAGSAREVRLDGDSSILFGENQHNGLSRIPLPPGDEPPSVLPKAVPVPGLEHLVTSRAWLVQAGHLLYVDAQEQPARLHSFDLKSGRNVFVTGPLPRLAFTDGNLSYLPDGKILVYSQWSEAAGSQIFALKWDQAR